MRNDEWWRTYLGATEEMGGDKATVVVTAPTLTTPLIPADTAAPPFQPHTRSPRKVRSG